jgi:hypothetical protein
MSLNNSYLNTTSNKNIFRHTHKKNNLVTSSTLIDDFIFKYSKLYRLHIFIDAPKRKNISSLFIYILKKKYE